MKAPDNETAYLWQLTRKCLSQGHTFLDSTDLLTAARLVGLSLSEASAFLDSSSSHGYLKRMREPADAIGHVTLTDAGMDACIPFVFPGWTKARSEVERLLRKYAADGMHPGGVSTYDLERWKGRPKLVVHAALRDLERAGEVDLVVEPVMDTVTATLIRLTDKADT